MNYSNYKNAFLEILSVYIFFYISPFDFSPEKTIPNILLLSISNLFISYILGKYSPTKYFKLTKLQSILLKYFSFIFVFSSFYIVNSLFIISGLKGLIPKVILNSLICICIGLFFIRYFHYNQSLSNQRPWIFIINDRNVKFVKPFINPIDIILTIDQAEQINDKKYSLCKGLVFDNSIELTDEVALSVSKYRSLGIRTIGLNKWFEIFKKEIPPEIFNASSLLFNSYRFNQPNTFLWRVKRSFDYSFSILLIVFTFPFLLIISSLIKLTDGGPVFYSQIRVGFSGKHFKVYKFRTMKVNSEPDGPEWSKHGDQRITPIGAILRKYRIDELPQLINVLKGDMSLIGPRPERPDIEKYLHQKIPNYKIRYLLLPGLSGWGQVNYSYGASIEDSRKKLSYDLYYILKASLMLDLIIFLRTIPTVFMAKLSTPRKTNNF